MGTSNSKEVLALELLITIGARAIPHMGTSNSKEVLALELLIAIGARELLLCDTHFPLARLGVFYIRTFTKVLCIFPIQS